MVKELLVDTEFPVATVPEGDAALPDDPIYDSSRSYAENKPKSIGIGRNSRKNVYSHIFLL